MKKKKFFAEWNEKEYEGYTRGEHWNGWQCPRFEFDIAREVANDIGGRYDETTDSFVFDDEDWPGHPEIFKGVDCDNGKHLYAIGAWCWTWS